MKSRIRCFLLEPTDQTRDETVKHFDSAAVVNRSLFRRADTGELMTLAQAPAGAMYYATWLEKHVICQRGPDGHILMVKTPGGIWNIDSVAGNCDRPDDKEHRCWCRHGVPPDITCDKVGNTCGAGAGSIQCGDYHGFLIDGWLEER